MRNGMYAIHLGIEYEVRVKDANSFILRSTNSSDVSSNGFYLNKGMNYVKSVQRSELKEVYRISTIAEFKGVKFQVIKEDGDNLLLSTMNGDYRVFEKLGMDMVDRGVYQKWVSKNDITLLQEIKTPV
jgi:hypothetical protein